MKKIVSLSLICAIIAYCLCLTSCEQTEANTPVRPEYIPEANTSEYDLYSDVYTKIAEQGDLILSYNEMTTDIKVTVKSTGYSWSTEYVLDGTINRGEILSLNYYSNTGATNTLTTSTDSIEKGQFIKTDIENGIKVQYGLGDINFKMVFPLACSPEKFAEYEAALKAKAEERVAAGEYESDAYEDYNYFFDSFELINFADEKYELYSEDDMEKVHDKYALALDTPWYYMTRKKIDKNINRLNEIFNTIGYTEEQSKSDNEGVAEYSVERPEFSISVYYRLTPQKLEIEIPEEEIYYEKDYTVETVSVNPHLLEFTDNYDGYFLLPDGSGSVMNFNNGKNDLRTDDVYVQMYGIDDSRFVDEKTSNYNNAIFPVFGTCLTNYSKAGKYSGTTSADDIYSIDLGGTHVEDVKINAKNPKTYNGAFMVIDEGATFAGISATSASAKGENNKAWVEFRINECVQMDTFSNSSGNGEKYKKFQFERYLGSLKLSCYFMTGENSSYSGMADLYSNLLFGNEKASTQASDYYSTVEMIGLINGNGHFLGVQYNTKEVLTSFEKAFEIASDLKSNGFNNMNVKLSGWCNGGYEHGLVEKLDIASQLGGAEGFEELCGNMKSIDVGLYADVDVQAAYNAQGTVSRDKNASSLNAARAYAVYRFDPVDFSVGSYASVLTIDALKSNLDGFLDGYSKYNNKNVSFRTLGQKINSNYRDEDFLEREGTKDKLVEYINGVKKDGYSIMGTQGDAPFINSLDVINDMPIISANYDKCDYSIPFTSMVLSGHVDYTYKSINLSNGERDDLLKLIEADAGAYFTFTGSLYDGISLTYMDYLYSTVYDDIKDTVLSKYKYVSNALDGLYGVDIVKHERLADEINKVTYANGSYIIVNYSDSDFTAAGGIKVASKDYTKVVNGEVVGK